MKEEQVTNQANVKKLTYSRKEAAAAIGVSMVTLDALMRRAENPVPFVKIGHRVLIPIAALEAWIDNNVKK